MLGEKLLVRIWDTLIANGIGGLLEPRQIRRLGTARAEVRRQEMLLLAQTERDVEAIRAGTKALDHKGRLIAAPSDGPSLPQDMLPTLLRHAQKEELIRSLERQIALARIAMKIEEEAEGVPDEQVSDDEVDPDWIMRWRLYAENVKNETVQRLWAQIFAGEVKQPGTYSLRTIDTLRQMQQREADMIATIASYRTGNFIMHQAEYFYQYDLTWTDVLTLEQMGIIVGSSSTLIERIPSEDANGFIAHLTSNDVVFRIQNDNNADPLQLEPVHRLTSVGREILTLGRFTTDERYVLSFAERLRGMGYRVSIARSPEDFKEIK